MSVTVALAALLSSLAASGAAVLAGRRARFLAGRASNQSAVQCAHARPTPRVGVASVAVGLAAAAWHSGSADLQALAAAASLVALVGLLEDVGPGVSPRGRLLAVAAAALAFGAATGHWLARTDVGALDAALGVGPLSVGVTVFIAAGLANGFNLIDGVNGLSSLAGIAAAMALALIALGGGDAALARFLAVFAAGLLGFFLLNYPWGLIFLGDGGAYTIGFVLAGAGLYAISALPGVTPWAILLAVFWPVLDTLLAVVRRASRRAELTKPDRLHAHQVVMRGLEILLLRRRRGLSNPLATAALAPFVLTPPVLAVLLRGEPLAAGLACLALAVAFFGAYFGFLALAARPRRRRAAPRHARAAR